MDKEYFYFPVEMLHTLTLLNNDEKNEIVNNLTYLHTKQEDKITFSCKQAKIWWIFYMNFYRRLKDRPENVYVVVLENKKEKFVKIGMTNNLKKRYNDFRRYGYKVIEIVTEQYSDNSFSYIRESNLLEKFKDYSYLPIKRFLGYTECFDLGILQHIKELKYE